MPTQCPECGRFLSNTLVEGLLEGDDACPKCQGVLTATMFYEFVDDAPAGRTAAPATPTAPAAPDEFDDLVPDADALTTIEANAAASAGDPGALERLPATDMTAATGRIASPDLSPGRVHDADQTIAPDALAGWDTEHEGDTPDGHPDGLDVPLDAIVLASGGIAGAMIGALSSRDHRGLGTVLGLLAGTAGAAISREVWRLDR